MKVGFIGPGKVGVNLGRYFTHKGIIISGYFGGNIKNTTEACEVTKSKVYIKLEEIINDSDIIFITTPDDIISSIDSKLSNLNLKNKSICHASGSLESTILSNAKLSGAKIYSIHPMFAFSNKNIELNKLENIYFSIEGDIEDDLNEESSVIKLMKSLKNKYFIRDIKYSSSYHLANVFVSNLVLSLINIGTGYLKILGLNEEDCIKSLYPLIQGNIDNIYTNGFQKSLSGPVLRGDLKTIKKHLKALKKEDKEIYNFLSINLLKVTAERYLNDYEEFNINSDVNNENALKILLQNSSKHNEIFNLIGGLEE